MYQRILLPLDGSPIAEQVIPYVMQLGKAFSPEIVLFQAFGPVPAELSDPQHGRYVDQLTTSFAESVLDYLETVAKQFRDQGLNATCVAPEGHPAEKIIEEANRRPNTLVAMSTHGRSGIGRWVMGSVTDKVLHAIHAPLLIVRAKEVPSTVAGLDRVIIPLDGSELSEKIMPHAIALAKGLGAPVTLIRTTHIPHYVPMDYPASMIDDLIRETTVEAEDYLRHISQQLSIEGVPNSQAEIRQQDAAGAILDLAGDSPGTLIAMSTHGHSGVGRWVLGSITDRVVRNSAGPVLVIRDPD